MADLATTVVTECALSTWTMTPATCRWDDKPLPPGRRRWCSKACEQAFTNNHNWQFARHAALKRDEYTCRHCGATGVALEVNHIEPRRGRGYGFGCHHHLDNLETLCHPCHVEVTKQQGREARLSSIPLLPAAPVPAGPPPKPKTLPLFEGLA